MEESQILQEMRLNLEKQMGLGWVFDLFMLGMAIEMTNQLKGEMI